MNDANIGWHSTLSHNLARVSAALRADELNATEQVAELKADAEREWAAMVKDVRFAMYGGVASPERRTAYIARRIDSARQSLAIYLHRPEYRALAAALGAVRL